jgi:hypothetical protein
MQRAHDGRDRPPTVSIAGAMSVGEDVSARTQPPQPTAAVGSASAVDGADSGTTDSVSPYDRPRRPHRAHGAELGAGGAAQLAVRGTEVVQVIQALDNRVRLVAGKPAVVRVYLDVDAFSSPTTVTGELTWRRGNGGVSFLAAMNRVLVDPANRPNLQQQRFDIAKSLNFVLPAAALTGTLTLRVNRVNVVGGQTLTMAAQPVTTVTFVDTPALRVKTIGLRYTSVRTGQTITPQAVHFDYLRSYLGRSYPVADVQWSQTVIDGDLLRPLSPPKTGFPQNQSLLTNAQLSALREREVSAGTDPRTHYFGLVDDEQGVSFMRGSALYDENTTIFGQVACGPCGIGNGFAGDDDASYADWYGAHELGHTFQRRHPGFPPANQDQDPLETGFPYENGFISTPDQQLVGFDIGDPALGLPMQALPGNAYHDVMTYADRQWLSAYTYEAMHDRLIREDTAFAPLVV